MAAKLISLPALCKNCKWREATGCPSRSGKACKAWEADIKYQEGQGHD